MNSVIFIGRLTKDPTESTVRGTDKIVSQFSIAVDRPFAKEKTADFFNISVFGKMAENCNKYLKKGSQVAIQGRIQNNNYKMNSGEVRYTNEIIADRVQFLSPKKNSGSSEDIPEGFEETDDEIPF